MPPLLHHQQPAILFRKALYIKLGEEGSWEADSIDRQIMRIGWPHNPLADINAQNWQAIGDQIRAKQPHRGTATRDVNALREIVLRNTSDLAECFAAEPLSDLGQRARSGLDSRNRDGNIILIIRFSAARYSVRIIESSGFARYPRAGVRVA